MEFRHRQFCAPTTRAIVCLVFVFAAIQAAEFASNMASTAQAQPPTNVANDDLSNEERKASVEKLHLEIAALKRQPVWYKPILDATPLITAILTLAGLWAGAYKYFGDRRQSRMANQKTQIRVDIDQILSFPADNKITVARITFLLHDLDELTANDAAARNNVTDVLEQLIANDLDFDRPRDVSFDVAAMSHWPDYEQRLRSQCGSPELIYKYYQALRHLYERNKPYFSTIEYNRAEERFSVTTYTYEAQFLHFAQLIVGYQKHLSFIRNPAERQTALQRLAEALHNSELVNNIFGEDEFQSSRIARR